MENKSDNDTYLLPSVICYIQNIFKRALGLREKNELLFLVRVPYW